MRFLNHIWSRYGARSDSSHFEYSPLNGDISPIDDTPNHKFSEKQLESVSILSWRTSPSFEIQFDLKRAGHVIGPFLLPSFLQATHGRQSARKLSPTAYLDGLRGVAALFVVFHHYALAFTSSSSYGWRSSEGDHDDWFFQLPMIRVVHSGRFMVGIFFVLSGYVLSHRGLKLGRNGEFEKLYESLSSSVFRRWIRLCLPVILSTFIAFLLARFSLWRDLPDGWEQWELGTHHAAKPVPIPLKKGDFTTQFWGMAAYTPYSHMLTFLDWYYDTQQLVDPFMYGGAVASHYNINILWTIPIELFGSMLVFMIVLALGRARTWVKIGTLSFLLYWCHLSIRWHEATFLSGILLAELSFVRDDIKSSIYFTELSQRSSNRLLCIACRTFWTIVFLIGTYVGTHPQDNSTIAPGYRTLMSHTPTQYSWSGAGNDFWLCVGAPLMILSLDNAAHLQRMFNNRFAQYLGRISFSLYMIHFMIMTTLAQGIAPWCMRLTGGWSNGQIGFLGGMAIMLSVVGPFTVWVSDMYTRGVDEQCVWLAGWVGKKALVSGKPSRSLGSF